MYNTEQFTIVTILLVGMYGTIYGTHRTPDTDTGHRHRTPTPNTDTNGHQHFNLYYYLKLLDHRY
jgi:hypothetical protein